MMAGRPAVAAGSVLVAVTAAAFAAAGALLLGGAATASRPARVVAAPRQAGCARRGATVSPSGVAQSMDGAISACLRVDALAPGRYTIVVDQVLDGAGDPVASVHEPAVQLTLAPAAGAPGTRVTVTGRTRAPVAHRSGNVDFCWDGCADGLSYSGVRVRWTSATSFRARLVVPAAPWLERGPDRVARLASGSYPIGVQCLTPARGCAGGAAEGSAEFALAVATAPVWCRTGASCASLRLTPAAARPGALAAVSGFAPLQSVIGAGQPFVYQLEILRGRPRGPEVDFGGRPAGDVTLGRAGLDVRAAPRFEGLTHAPLARLGSGLSPIAADPADPSTVAWCGHDAVELSSGGATTSVSTAGAAAALARIGFETPGGGNPACVGVAPAAGGLAVAFDVALRRFSAPPVYDVALETTAGGRTWKPVPVPRGASPESFGGFRYGAGGSVEAVFARSRTPRLHGHAELPVLDPARPLAETTTDGGLTWRSGRLPCPAAGPCVTLAPYIPQNCAMVQDVQPLLRSADGGRTWRQPPLPDAVQACGDAQLLATSGRSLLLVNPASQYELVGSGDGGTGWRVLGVPPIPGVPRLGFPAETGAGDGLGPASGGLTVLGGGALLETGATRAWHLLRAGAAQWCAVRSLPSRLMRAFQLSPITVIGDRLWWLSGNDDNSAEIHDVPAASVSC
jgi:hypothetical protein